MTYLDWDGFSYDLSKGNCLRGKHSWEIWKTAFWVALMSVGYIDVVVYVLLLLPKQ